jgi:pimeloyl-ACP methyl ester carboxylesterase
MPTFERFELDFIEVPEATLRVRHGGTGPAVLLLHGHPRTHTTWHRVAPILSDSFTVVCPDLRGFDRSSKPADTPDHNGSSKRAKASDCVALMDRLGFERFAVVGHDRGCYTAFRTAMDHPGAISRLAVLDGVPILEAWNAATNASRGRGGTGSSSDSRQNPSEPFLPIQTLGTAVRLRRWGPRTTPTTAPRSTNRRPSTA